MGTIDTLTSALMTPFNSQFKLMRDEIQELKDRSSAAATARPVNSADPPPPLKLLAISTTIWLDAYRLSKDNNSNSCCITSKHSFPPPPQGARNKIKSDRSQ